MKKNVLVLLTMSMFVVASPVFAGHDHGGSNNSKGPESSQDPKDEQSAKASEMLIKSCTQQVASIERHIDRLQAKMTEKRTVSSINDELEMLEQKLKEANEIVRALQIF